MPVSLLFRCLIGVILLGVIESAALSSSVQNSIETRVIVDSWALNSWKDKVATSAIESKRIEETKTILEEYINSAFHDLNSVFKDLISSGINLDARIVSIEFITDEAITIESPVGSGQGRSETLLEEFQLWLATKNYASTDHTMLLTGLDLTKGGRTSNSGVAYLGAMCSSTNSVSASELTPGGSVVLTMAHELGHSFSSSHDGPTYGNRCGEGYIMEDSHDLSKAASSNFRYSSCSISQIKTFLQKLHNSGSCLAAADTKTAALPSTLPLGERYTPDQICKLAIESSSYFCRTLYGVDGGKDYSTICSVMYCKTSKGSCSTIRASDGFVCGHGKSCSLGECVLDASAPKNVAETCPQGDTKDPINDDGQTCSQAINAHPGHCYSSFYLRGCCAACESAKTRNADCEFGDKATWCIGRNYPSDCYANGQVCCGTCAQHRQSSPAGCEYGDRASWCGNFISQNIDNCKLNSEACCKSCENYGSSSSGSTTGSSGSTTGSSGSSGSTTGSSGSSGSSGSTTGSSGSSGSTTGSPGSSDSTTGSSGSTTGSSGSTTGSSGSSGSEAAGTTTAAPTTPAPPTCTDGSSQCAGAIPGNNALCYNAQNEQLCCASCASVASASSASCKYGDRATWCATYIAADINNCKNTADVCCKSCENYDPTACTDGSSRCASAIAGKNALCYNANNEKLCCASCAKIASSDPNCKYGDKASTCDASKHCPFYAQTYCCKTCNATGK